MNTPNKLSLSRALLVIPVVLLLSLQSEWCRWGALLLFSAAALTDLFDGRIARSRNLVTNFGKFIDPLADKLLVLSTMIALCGRGELPVWLCVLVLFRELAIDGLRLVAAKKGVVIAAARLGKWKTVCQMTLLIWCLARPEGWLPESCAPVCAGIRWVLIIAAALLTLISGAEYFRRNRTLLQEDLK